MVVIVDLSAANPEAHTHPQWLLRKPVHSSVEPRKPATEDTRDDRPNLNLNGFSAALSCYPIVSQLASLLDLNTLHSLSRTCRQFRVNLLQFRDQLVTQSLRCSREDAQPGVTPADKQHTTWRSSSSSSSRTAIEWPGPRITSGKVGKCARDMVAECRRCGTVICRNCTAKTPSGDFSGRHRRLCRTCLSVPLACHTTLRPSLPTPSQPRSTRSRNSSSPSPPDLYRISTLTLGPSQPAPFTAPAFHRTPCTCPTDSWLCQTCGHALRLADTQYARGWAWRTHYTAYSGGLGTGIGEGNEAVECGRRGHCFAAKVVEHEVERDEAAAGDEGGRTWEGGGFEVQEMEGVGGVVKKKVKRMVRVGRWVEWEDERDGLPAEGGGGRVLEREISGKVRSWCAWCERVIPCAADLEAEAEAGAEAEREVHA